MVVSNSLHNYFATAQKASNLTVYRNSSDGADIMSCENNGKGHSSMAEHLFYMQNVSGSIPGISRYGW